MDLQPIDSKRILDWVRESWHWMGLDPANIVAENDFGHLIIEDAGGRYWRLVPENASCEVVAESGSLYEALRGDEDFVRDWAMASIESLATKTCGSLRSGRKYCLKIPAVFGGDYEAENLAPISFEELIRFSANIARQIKDIPEGEPVRLVVTE